MSREARTERFEDLWLPPVPSATALPLFALDGQMCFVQDEEAIYAFQHGSWMSAVSRPSSPAGPSSEGGAEGE